MAKEQLEAIYEELLSVFDDIRAEVIVSEITANSSATTTDFSIQNISTFSRSHRRDIQNHKNSLTNANHNTINLNLSRNGIYDNLPEGVFHDPLDPTLKAMTHQKRREKQKNEEKEARKFFQPIENEIFNQYVGVESAERSLIDKFSDIKDNYFLRFWKIDPALPENFVIKLIRLLPYVHKISGNLELTALCLEKIINEKVSLTKIDSPYTIHAHRGGLKDKLAVNMVLGVEESVVRCPEIEVNIGPVKKKNIKNFIKNTPHMRFLNVFYDYFLPMEMDVTTKIDFERSRNNFVLDQTEPAIMGLTTAL